MNFDCMLYLARKKHTEIQKCPYLRGKNSMINQITNYFASN